MSEIFFLRYLLSSKKRVDAIGKYGLDTEVGDIVGLFTTLGKLFPANAYPLPKSLLMAELPQYEELWTNLPDYLSPQEEGYCLLRYQTKVGLAAILAKFAQKKTNPIFVQEIWEELGGLFKEIDYEEVEEEFDLLNIHQFLEEDRKLLEGIIPTPFPKLNYFLGGGFLPQRLYVFESTSKVGKSTLLLYIGMWLANQGFKVKYISTELLPLEARERIIPMAQAFKDPVTIKKYASITTEEIKEAVKPLLSGGFTYKFMSIPSMTEVEAYLRGQEFDLLILDHPSHTLMRPKEPMGNSEEWKVVKSIYRDIFKFARESRKAVLLPSWVNRAGHESLIKHHDAESYHTQGAFDNNAILDAKFLVIPRDDLKKDGEYVTQIKPLHLRRKGSQVDMNEVIQLAFNDTNYLYREVPTVSEGVKKAMVSYAQRADTAPRKKKEWKETGMRRKDINW